MPTYVAFLKHFEFLQSEKIFEVNFLCQKRLKYESYFYALTIQLLKLKVAIRTPTTTIPNPANQPGRAPLESEKH